jgi:AcrR family transcriptional regulator
MNKNNSKGMLSKARILQAAVELACEQGLTGLHLQPLAERVGLTKSGVYAHFRSREALQLSTLAELAERFLATVVAPSKQDAPGLARLEGVFARWLGWPTNAGLAGDCPLLAAAAGPSGLEREALAPAVRRRLEALFAEFRSVLLGLHAAAVRRGEVSGSDPGACVQTLIALRFGHRWCGTFLRDPLADELTRRAFRQALAVR